MRYHICTAALALVIAAPVSGAQTSTGGERVYASIGVSGAVASLQCARCSGTEHGAAVLARAGAAPARNLLVGAELTHWRKTFASGGETGATSLTFANVVAHWYPWAAARGFVKAGVGLGWISSSADLAGFGEATARSSGAAGVVGVGWDRSLAGGLSLTPYVDVDLSAKRAPHGSAASPRDPLGGRLMQAGVSLTVRR